MRLLAHLIRLASVTHLQLAFLHYLQYAENLLRAVSFIQWLLCVLPPQAAFSNLLRILGPDQQVWGRTDAKAMNLWNCSGNALVLAPVIPYSHFLGIGLSLFRPKAQSPWNVRQERRVLPD